ncbi:hypothetical protein A2154_04720 [Candidatus Gottesmanbacteria bacterium RBG_16_43_7]|uniref:Uncharacterized protein n=1 Tax=Candidatus Gottesmanbacteria bacterium RBG_16_43_7 TaxID=1798373 RepID=A0A1F5Z7M0_9BACT|nr:MAG: hypothetical protein A2154_04720 [Candidatus Gottesmanbacteria bacterium RBG_16_43_7]
MNPSKEQEQPQLSLATLVLAGSYNDNGWIRAVELERGHLPRPVTSDALNKFREVLLVSIEANRGHDRRIEAFIRERQMIDTILQLLETTTLESASAVFDSAHRLSRLTGRIRTHLLM